MAGALEAMLAKGVITLFALAVLAGEILFLALSRKQRGVAMIANAASGLFLILALDAALRGASAIAVAGCLTLGGVAHFVDLVVRLRS